MARVGRNRPSRIGAPRSGELAGERWPDFSDQAPTLYAVLGGGAKPQQALYMVGLILPPKAST